MRGRGRCRALRLATSDDTFWCAPGGSSVTGALGHLNAALELAEQVRAGEIPQPDVIVVGAGSCGTMAGLTAGFRVAGLDVRLIGVRYVDRIVCHARAIARLANGVLARIGMPGRIHANDITLVDSPLDHGYGVPLGRAEELMASFEADEGIRLDTTYTSKVVAKLGELLSSGMFTCKERSLLAHVQSRGDALGAGPASGRARLRERRSPRRGCDVCAGLNAI